MVFLFMVNPDGCLVGDGFDEITVDVVDVHVEGTAEGGRSSRFRTIFLGDFVAIPISPSVSTSTEMIICAEISSLNRFHN